MNSHKAKMESKKRRRQLQQRSTPIPLVLANLSKNHPDYGMSPAEHEAAKAARRVVM